MSSQSNDALPNNTTSQPADPDSSKEANRKFYAFAAFATLIAIIFFAIPYPTFTQYTILRVFVSILAGLSVLYIPGTFKLEASIKNFKNIKARGALGFAVLIYLGIPKIKPNDKPGTFTFTIVCTADAAYRKNLNYPRLAGDTIQLRLGNILPLTRINENLEADFKGISSIFEDQRVGITLRSEFWSLISDSIEFKGNNTTAFVKPSGKLDYYSGQVKDESTGCPVSGALVTIDKTSNSSDSLGMFTIAVPFNSQRLDYTLSVQKEPYTLWKNKVAATTSFPILLQKK